MDNKIKNRNPNIDLIRVLACYGVISIHFFWRSGQYSEIINYRRMYAMVFLRELFMYCVPMFIMLSGYLENKKQISKSYYKKIVKVLFIYVAASFFCYYGLPFLYNFFKTNWGLPDVDFENNSFKGFIKGVLSFRAAPYSWYIEMYIGLFLIIPFLNILFRNLTSKEKLILLVVLFLITSLPSIINVYYFDNKQWWIEPANGNYRLNNAEFQKIIPDWWRGCYPILYYYIGSYYSDRKIKIKPIVNILLILFTVALSGGYSLWRSHNFTFQSGLWNDWNSAFNVVLTALIFILLLNLKLDNMSVFWKKAMTFISDLCLGIYLVSYVFDKIFYPKLEMIVPVVNKRLEYYFIIVPIIFICSAFISFIINTLYNVILVLMKKIRDSLSENV